MDEEKFLLLSLDDSRTKRLSEVLGSKTARKIIDYLAENDSASEKDLSDSLDVPINTIEYNIKKLVESGLVHKKKNFFWSKKGKKIVMYGLSNKSIVISPRKSTSEKFKSVLPVLILGTVLSFASFVYDKLRVSSDKIVNGVANTKVYAVATQMASSGNLTNVASSGTMQTPNSWLWFLFGSFLMVIIFTIITWRKL